MATPEKRQTLRLKTPAFEENPAKSAAVEALSAKVDANIDALQMRLEQAKGQIAAMQAKLQHDPTLPVMRQDAFVREVKARLPADNDTDPDRRAVTNGPGCIAEIQLQSMADILMRHGDRASDFALNYVASFLSGHVRGSDRVGRLGTASFGVLLAHADPDAVQAKLLRLCARIEAGPCLWDGEELRISLSFRVASMMS